MKKLLTALAMLAAAIAVPLAAATPASADPVPYPYCAYDATGNAGSWSDWCLPVGLQPGQPIGGNPGITTYNPPAMPWAPATSPTTGNTINPFAPGGSMW